MQKKTFPRHLVNKNGIFLSRKTILKTILMLCRASGDKFSFAFFSSRFVLSIDVVFVSPLFLTFQLKGGIFRDSNKIRYFIRMNINYQEHHAAM